MEKGRAKMKGEYEWRESEREDGEDGGRRWSWADSEMREVRERSESVLICYGS
mgnify:CR=1 FL=1